MSLENLRAAARDWDEKKRPSEWLLHSGARLQDAEGLLARENFARFILPNERDYLIACRKQDDENRDRGSRTPGISPKRERKPQIARAWG